MADDLTSGLAGLIVPIVVGGIALKFTDYALGGQRVGPRKRTGQRARGFSAPGRSSRRSPLSKPSMGNFSNLGF